MKHKIFTSFLLLTLAACASDADSVIENNISKIYKTDINVYISNGKKQCLSKALPMSVTKGYLDTAKINVSAQSCGVLTGIMYASVCGGPTGQVHVFTIDETDLNKAKALGFAELSETPNGIAPVECKSFGTSKSGPKF